jgi:hypothetical protein
MEVQASTLGEPPGPYRSLASWAGNEGRAVEPCYNPGMSTQDLDDKAKELKQGRNIFCRKGIADALREVKYRRNHEMYGKAKEAVEDFELLVSRIPACNPKPKLKQGPQRQRNSK